MGEDVARELPWGAIVEKLPTSVTVVLALGVLIYFFVKLLRTKDPAEYVLEALDKAPGNPTELVSSISLLTTEVEKLAKEAEKSAKGFAKVDKRLVRIAEDVREVKSRLR